MSDAPNFDYNDKYNVISTLEFARDEYCRLVNKCLRRHLLDATIESQIESYELSIKMINNAITLMNKL